MNGLNQPLNEQSLSPDTTLEQNLNTHGQRRINLIWEFTQAYLGLWDLVY